MTRIATFQYSLSTLQSFIDYKAKIENIVKTAKEAEAELLLLPEYSGTEMACGNFASDEELYDSMQLQLVDYRDFFSDCAVRYKMYILAGTVIEKVSHDEYVNRAYFFSPNGKYGFQDKLQLITYEKNLKVIRRGSKQTLFDTALGKIGVAICYDSEFPEIVRSLTNAGAELILVPSYTSSDAGYHRVFLSCRARAIENQCYVAVSFVVGPVGLSGDVEMTYGKACVLGPADLHFPSHGIIAQHEHQEPAMLIADLDFAKLNFVRENGNTQNYLDQKYLDFYTTSLTTLVL